MRISRFFGFLHQPCLNRIHRISWSDIRPLSPVLVENSSEFTGSVHVDGREFSSLINKQMAAKCSSVGADAHLSKPQINHLIEVLDRLCFAQPCAVA